MEERPLRPGGFIWRFVCVSGGGNLEREERVER
jgi:hypothetical protein